ncbi:MAG: hypothetical protein H7318_07320 [Oligoflexus sp.]|nr:hypothetical protein [Oligoflexus sp.]
MPLARHVLSICALLCFSTLFSCSTVPKETSKGKIVKVIKSPFAETCIQLAKIKYDGTPFIHDKALAIILKEMTAQNKGNAVRYDTFTPGVTGVSNAKGRATAYRCHREKLKKYLQGLENKAFGEEETDPEYQEAKDANGGPAAAEAAPASKAVTPKTAAPVPAPAPVYKAAKPKKKGPANASSEP